MQLGVDAIVLRGYEAGTLRYVNQLLAGLSASLQPTAIFVTPGSVPVFPGLRYLEVQPSRWLPRAVTQQIYSRWNRAGHLDLLHSPAFVPPLHAPCPTVMTLFDLTFMRFPETMKWTGRLWWWAFGRRGIARADRVIAISESTKRDAQTYLGIAPTKIAVVYPATHAIFQPGADTARVATRYGLPDRYILYVGTLERRKNLVMLVRAFALARKQGVAHALVIVGPRGWLDDDIFRAVEELHLTRVVIFLGHVPEADLPGLYASADLFAYLSLYEGFGLPVLEAMACGTPVLVSDTSALPEVVGQAGVLVPPGAMEHIASTICKILADQELRGIMKMRGLERASFFSQAKLIAETLGVYRDAISH